MSARSYVLGTRRQGNITVDRTALGTKVVLHSTTIINQESDGSVTLNSGGWLTVTTKTAMNRYFQLTGMPCFILQKKGRWYVNYNEVLLPYNDHMIIRG